MHSPLRGLLPSSWSSPLVVTKPYCHYVQQVYSGRIPRLEDCSKDFNLFIMRSIQRMSAGQLRESLSTGQDGVVYERHYQMEWYRAATSYLPENVRIAPDVGAVGTY